MVLAPLLVLGTLEVCLRLMGFGYPTSYFQKMDDGRNYTPNRLFGWQFFPRETSTYPHPFLMPVEKQPGTLRIFILGESAALGTPAPPFGFGRILEVMLRQQFPGKRFEIVNAAMRGVDSNIILPIAKECAGHQPDLFIVYMGNNEAIGLYSPEPDSRNITSNLSLLRTMQRFKATRLYQCLASGTRKLRKNPERKTQDMEFFRKHRFAADDPRRNTIYRNFRANLEDICRAAGHAGAKTIVSTVGVNLKDFPPLGSLHRPGLQDSEKSRWESAYAAGITAETAGQFDQALTSYLEAVRLDDRFAELQFRLGRCYSASGQFELARQHYDLARDWDALQFRSDSRLNRIIREVASAQHAEGISLVDTEQALADSPLSDHRTTGSQIFNDHVHFSFDGDYLMARSMFSNVVSCLGLTNAAGPSGAGQLPSRAECADWLGFTSWEDVNVAAGVVRSMANPPFLDQLDHAQRQARAEQAVQEGLGKFNREQLQNLIPAYRTAIARNPSDWQLHFTFANFFLYGVQDYNAAAEEFKVVVNQFPKLQPMRHALGNALLSAGKWDEATEQFNEILRLDPDFVPAREAIARINSQRWNKKTLFQK